MHPQEGWLREVIKGCAGGKQGFRGTETQEDSQWDPNIEEVTPLLT